MDKLCKLKIDWRLLSVLFVADAIAVILIITLFEIYW